MYHVVKMLLDSTVSEMTVDYQAAMQAYGTAMNDPTTMFICGYDVNPVTSSGWLFWWPDNSAYLSATPQQTNDLLLHHDSAVGHLDGPENPVWAMAAWAAPDGRTENVFVLAVMDDPSMIPGVLPGAMAFATIFVPSQGLACVVPKVQLGEVVAVEIAAPLPPEATAPGAKVLRRMAEEAARQGVPGAEQALTEAEQAEMIERARAAHAEAMAAAVLPPAPVGDVTAQAIAQGQAQHAAALAAGLGEVEADFQAKLHAAQATTMLTSGNPVAAAVVANLTREGQAADLGAPVAPGEAAQAVASAGKAPKQARQGKKQRKANPLRGVSPRGPQDAAQGDTAAPSPPAAVSPVIGDVTEPRGPTVRDN